MTDASSVIVPLGEVFLYAAANPAVIAVAFWMGRKVDQPAKLLIAAFAGAIAGVAVLYVLSLLGMFDAPRAARAAGGIFVASLVTGLIYAWAGWRLGRG